MLDVINTFNLFKQNFNDWIGLCDVELEAVSKTFNTLQNFAVGVRDPVGIGECYFHKEKITKEIKKVDRYNDYLKQYNMGIQLDSNTELSRWEEFLREGCAEWNSRIVKKLTADLGFKKQAENYTKSVVARQKSALFKCEACEVPCYTNSPSVYDAHLNTKSHIIATDGNPELYTCKGCGEEFENTKAKKRHEEARKCKELRTCNDCGSTLSSKQRYEDHFISGVCNVKLKDLIHSGKIMM